ncbi:hypothetical protein Lpp125_00832 [Lacticaseibacillus paracasei subsp. paracasei Lpp125]|uniref:YopX family protein n=1 Tax=Lacticaseibacillus paracasei TaxID=1597 RepID=UPI0003433DEE|nr:YopX family protein [Lacticaseibacillus paracasei]EPD02459.1 hypothetical protein Lpp125_00832 [Lacticaseibacillus paracasei subsp. paracasei Lpp125]
MKREIKFRAWDKKRKSMFVPDSFVFDANTVEIVSVWRKTTDGETIEGLDPRKGRLVLMQYAGLHDKNGREIYESDILKVTGEDGESYAATVKWFGDEDYPAFDLEGIPETWFYGANALATIFQEGVETCEVIGNIFENPELLEGKQ